MIGDVHHVSGIRIFSYYGSPIQGSKKHKKHWIPAPQHCTRIKFFLFTLCRIMSYSMPSSYLHCTNAADNLEDCFPVPTHQCPPFVLFVALSLPRGAN
jgi:hypothetical protein